MGQSTDGLLWFGLASDAEEFPEGVEDVLRATVPDDEDFDDDPQGYADKVLEPFGCRIVQHCSCECPMYGVALIGTESRAWRGSPVPVETATRATEDVVKLKQACKAIGWPWSEPKWWLASNWC